MTDDQHGEGTPQGAGRWDPLPQGDYDDGATAFVKLPEGGMDALLSGNSPLAAPGHGYVPPQIAVAPAPTDPNATGAWTAPAGGAEWPDANAVPSHETGGDDRFAYNPGATGQWTFDEPAPAPGHDVTGQWSIPVAGGDLPDESGEFTTSSLIEQWGGTPPATLPGGAQAPWATSATGEPWGQQAAGSGVAEASSAAAGAGVAEPSTVSGHEQHGHGPGQSAREHEHHGRGPGQPAHEHEQHGHGPGQSAREHEHHGRGPGQPAHEHAAHEGTATHYAPHHSAEAAADAAPHASEAAEEAAEGPRIARDAQEPTEPPARPGSPAGHGPAPGSDAAEDAASGHSHAETPDGAANDPSRDESPASADTAATGSHDDPAPGPDDTPAAGAPDSASPPPPPHEEHPLASYVLRVNGAERPVADAWIGESLLYVLRERLGLAGAKDGCSQGECGACNVQVDGRLVASCLVPAVTAAGSEVRTVEGLAEDGQPSDVQRALARCGAVQCGFCVPGMAMTVHDLLEGNPAPTDLETRQALCGNLCRCSGYRGVVEAVKEVVAEREAHREANAETEPDEARIPHQAGPGAGGVHPSVFEQTGPHDRTYGQGQDGGQA